MSLKIITISDGFESSSVPAINLPTVERVQTFHHVLTTSDVINGYVTLPADMLFPSETVLLWEGISQTYGEDFTGFGNKVTFVGGFAGLILPTDNITIIFS